jgi:uncharacterized protein
VPASNDDVRSPSLTTRLRTALTEAMSSRDVTAAAAIRSALGAIGNAEAIAGPAQPARTSSQYVAGAVSGLGRAEATRKQLSGPEISGIVAAEIAEREAAAAQFDILGHAGQAERLRREALVLAEILGTR